MKAITYSKYGSPDVLEYEEIEKPTPADDEVLIKVHAASVNPLDWHFMRGEPGYKPALWIFAVIVFMRLAMSLNSIFNGRSVLVSADGIPLDTFTPAGARTVVIRTKGHVSTVDRGAREGAHSFSE